MHPKQPAPKKTNRTLLIVLSAVLGVLVLCIGAAVIAGLTQDKKDEPAAAASSVASASAAPSTAAAAAPAPTSTDLYIAALAGIDPAFTTNVKAAVNNGENICLDIKQGKDAATVQKNTAARFKTTAAKAAEVVAATKQHLCPVAA